jgi:hypothetical protein
MMKMSTKFSTGLIFGILLFGLLVAPVCAADDSSWLRPDSLDEILEWLHGSSQDLWTVPGGTGTEPVPTPSYTLSDDTAWFTPASQDQVIAWGKMIAKQQTTTYPTTLSQADRIRLFKSYSTNGYVPVTPTMPVTPLPTTLPVTIPTTPGYLPSGMPTMIPTLSPTPGEVTTPVTFLPVPSYSDRFATQKPTIPATPYYMPSKTLTVPTVTPTTGSDVSGSDTIALTELSLQGKYVRITNTGTTPVVMTGWKITNSQGNALTFIDFPLGGGTTFTYVLNPYSTLTVYFGKEGMVSANELYYPSGVDFWNTLGDTASLYNPLGQLAGQISA